MRSPAVVARVLICMTLGFAGAAYAQDLDRTSVAAVQPYAQAAPLSGDTLAIPGNIFTGPEYQVLLETLLARSASFRRQCVRIGNERSLMVHVRYAHGRLAGGVRAVTRISRHAGGRIVAHVTVDPLDNAVEMIAHEFEHIIEQLDKVDLAEKARRPHSGVHAVHRAERAFETTRALQMGRRVVEESRRSARRESDAL